MTIRDALYSHLSTVATTVVDLVSGRVYPVGVSPKTVTYPLITFSQISNIHERHLGGGGGVTHPRFEVNCWDTTYKGADDVAESVRKVLDNFRGTLGATGSQANVNGIFLEDDGDSFAASIDKSQIGNHNKRMDFTIWHVESVTPAT